jgi:hypothetical protein
VTLQDLRDASEWTLTNVYGPQLEADKIAFLEELKSLQGIQREWLICGGFNLIYKTEDKSNSRLNRRLMGRFKAVLDELELRELPLHARKSTWTSAQPEAMMIKIDPSFLCHLLGRAFSYNTPSRLGVHHLGSLPSYSPGGYDSG